MTTRDRKCSKQGSIAGMCARCIQVENVFKRGNFGKYSTEYQRML